METTVVFQAKSSYILSKAFRMVVYMLCLYNDPDVLHIKADTV